MPTLLFLDDNRYLRRLYMAEFPPESYNVVLASTPKEAIEKLQAIQPDVVIMDVNGLHSDGAGVIAEILSRLDGVPLILYTGFGSPESYFMSWVATACLLKSYDLGELRDTVRQILNRTRSYSGPPVAAH